MISLAEFKDAIGNQDMPDEEAEALRAACYALVELYLYSYDPERLNDPDEAYLRGPYDQE